MAFLGGGSGAISPVRILREQTRQGQTQDFNFVKSFLYFFELEVPPAKAKGKSNKFFFPLILNPTSYSMEEPFALQTTLTRGGGIYTEENGIVQRTIRLRGTTGFKPRLLPVNSTTTSLVVTVSNSSHSRKLAGGVLDAISGHKHFQYLQDSVFRMYGDLKRDPSTSEETKMFFHNPKDQEDWLVKPVKFTMNRSSDKQRVTYEYDIELLVVGGAHTSELYVSEDKGLVDTIKDGLRMAQSFVDMGTGFVNDVTASLSEIETLVKNVATVVSSISNLANAASAFIEGVTDLIEAPLATVPALCQAVDDINNTLETLETLDVRNIPTAYKSSWRRAGDALNRLGTHPELFETNAQRTLRNIRERQERTNITGRAALASAPGTINNFSERGTEPLPGEVQRAAADLGINNGLNKYSSAVEYIVEQGDTLASIAAKRLGDARLWQDIAVVNGLQAPYIQAQADAALAGPSSPIPGVVLIGGSIKIPSFSQPPQRSPLTPVLGVSNEAPFEDQMCGTDFFLEPTDDSRKQYDWVVDTDHGAVDLKTIRGVSNLGQALTTRLSTERGQNPLFKHIGVQRIIGMNFVGVDMESARFRVIEAIVADPRIEGIANIRFLSLDTDSPDVLVVDVDAAVRGLSQGASVQAIGVAQ